MAPPDHVQLNLLSDHDLLLRIAEKCECIPLMKRDIDANTERSRDNETELARLAERQKVTTGVLGTLAVVGSAIASGIGLSGK